MKQDTIRQQSAKNMKEDTVSVSVHIRCGSFLNRKTYKDIRK